MSIPVYWDLNFRIQQLENQISNKTADALKTSGGAVQVYSAAPPTAGQVLTATGSNSAEWQVPSGGGSGPGGAASGDLSGNYPAPIVIQARGLKTATSTVVIEGSPAPATGQVLVATSSTAAVWTTYNASGPASGDLGGLYPSPAVLQARGLKTASGTVNVESAIAPSSGQVLTATSATTAQWSDPTSGAPSGTAGGDLSGTYPNPTVSRASGLRSATTTVAIATAAAPSAGQVLTAINSTSAQWATPSTVITGSAGGDLSGTYPNPTVTQARGLRTATTTVEIATSAAPNAGQVLTAISSTSAQWADALGGAPSGTAGGDLSGTYPNPTVTRTSGIKTAAGTVTINPTAPTSGQVLIATSSTTAQWGSSSSGGSASGDISGTYPGPITVNSSGGLKTSTGTVTVSSALAPIAGQVLTATSGTTADWETPTSGVLTLTQATHVYVNASTGNDGNAGTTSSPWQSLDKAMLEFERYNPLDQFPYIIHLQGSSTYSVGRYFDRLQFNMSKMDVESANPAVPLLILRGDDINTLQTGTVSSIDSGTGQFLILSGSLTTTDLYKGKWIRVTSSGSTYEYIITRSVVQSSQHYCYVAGPISSSISGGSSYNIIEPAATIRCTIGGASATGEIGIMNTDRPSTLPVFTLANLKLYSGLSGINASFGLTRVSMPGTLTLLNSSVTSGNLSSQYLGGETDSYSSQSGTYVGGSISAQLQDLEHNTVAGFMVVGGSITGSGFWFGGRFQAATFYGANVLEGGKVIVDQAIKGLYGASIRISGSQSTTVELPTTASGSIIQLYDAQLYSLGTGSSHITGGTTSTSPPTFELRGRSVVTFSATPSGMNGYCRFYADGSNQSLTGLSANPSKLGPDPVGAVMLVASQF